MSFKTAMDKIITYWARSNPEYFVYLPEETEQESETEPNTNLT